ncbi:hypothetical protein JVT61DRAFT_4256 [Boletus reticuloceps]|uniref:Uncharacterized protein n=1 Tax=Boletus reticuloceps TaxID=495285 RepID=A0A8I3A748_9AGAM|nr:hypothetical protein JVT61DRAFT_4256 [Boletus reticuloceps]
MYFLYSSAPSKPLHLKFQRLPVRASFGPRPRFTCHLSSLISTLYVLHAGPLLASPVPPTHLIWSPFWPHQHLVCATRLSPSSLILSTCCSASDKGAWVPFSESKVLQGQVKVADPRPHRRSSHQVSSSYHPAKPAGGKVPFTPQHKPLSSSQEVCSSGDSLVQQPPPTHTSDKAEHAQIEWPGSNDDMLSYITTSITSIISNSRLHQSPNQVILTNVTTEEAGEDTSKFKLGSFPWTSLATILAEQGLVMCSWPTLVWMPSKQHGQTARTKGIMVLKKAEQRALYDALENTNISITRVEGRDE